MTAALPRETLVASARVLQQDFGTLAVAISELINQVPGSGPGSDVVITLENERVDRIVQSVSAQQGMHSDAVDEIVSLVDARLELNRSKAA